MEQDRFIKRVLTNQPDRYAARLACRANGLREAARL
jgi:hypothetical protein